MLPFDEPALATAALLASIMLFWLLSRLYAPYYASTGGCDAGAADPFPLLGMRAKWLAFVELRPPRLDCLEVCRPIPLVLLFVDFCLELPPLMKPECTTVIELELGAPPPRDAGPTLLVWC